MSSLRLIACGGTFDKRYDPIAGELVFGDSHLGELVARARLAVPVAIETPMQIDSLDMGPEHRERILAACVAAPELAVVIVHGTDTMTDTGVVLGQHVDSLAAKTIVLTGAMVPYAIANSDALFNLGFACACAQTLPPGVWIAMNGRVHRFDAVRKNRVAGLFEPLSPD